MTPLGSAVIRVGPLDPGYLYISGAAYDIACSGVPYYGLADGGNPDETYIADPLPVLVLPGAPTSATLYFHQRGSLNLNVDFGNCDDPNGPYYYQFCYDAGGPFFPGIDAGPISSDDAGLPSEAGPPL